MIYKGDILWLAFVFQGFFSVVVLMLMADLLLKLTMMPSRCILWVTGVHVRGLCHDTVSLLNRFSD